MEQQNGISQWFTLQVMSGQENRVEESLQNRNTKDLSMGIDHGLEEVLVPTTSIVERRAQKTVVRKQKTFPGYVFVRARIYDESGRVIPEHWQFVKETKGVIGFMGGENPIPLSEKDVSGLMSVSEENDKPKPEKTWKVGDQVVVKEGPFENFAGVIESVDEEHHRLKVSVILFDRPTICETDYWQVDVPGDTGN